MFGSVIMSTGRQVNVQDICSLRQVINAVPNACVKGMVTSVSRVKQGRNSKFFDGTMYDGDSKMRFVGFYKDQHKRISRFCREEDCPDVQL